MTWTFQSLRHGVVIAVNGLEKQALHVPIQFWKELPLAAPQPVEQVA